MSNYRIFLLSALIVLSTGRWGWSAQSSADVPVTEKTIAEARASVFGDSREGGPKESEYVVGHGDVLSVQVYGEGDMSAANIDADRSEKKEDSLRSGSSGAQVRIDGRISLKHVGDIDAVGFTLTQLADYLKKIYSSVYDDPIVTVVLVQGNSQRYTVMGKVVKPGVFYLDYPINLVQVVARSGGFTEWAKSQIKLVRKGPEKSNELFNGNTLSFDYGDFLDGKELEKNVLIKPGDIIIVN
ncbi:MAG: hypothetical protein A2X81_03315 [Desulfobacterales bacterium GWB2_56_26]|nr:MAG: hypothetical protein A2X81_03315 [Desulfobacterales bacterium GWB2_56_26]